jgi:YaiO family outer membrane protein
VLSELEYNGSNGWGGEVGFRHTEYTNALVNLVNFTVERSWGNYRAAYMRFQGFLLGHDKTASNAIQGAKYYGDHNWFGVTISAGNELEVDATQIPSRVLSSHVSTVVFSGLHWLKPTLGLTYTLGNFHQGTSYVRNGMQLGLRRQF